MPPSQDVRGVDRERRKGVCGICPAGCWVEVELQDGRLVGIEADPDHPLGMLCHRGKHAPEIVYSEHRLRHPLRRTGPKGPLDHPLIESCSSPPGHGCHPRSVLGLGAMILLLLFAC